MTTQHTYSAYELIDKKKRGLTLSLEEISFFIDGLMNQRITSPQMAALLMASFLQGFNTEETRALTQVMLESGKTLDFFDCQSVDKHSTGGIGDKTTFLLAPLAHACGVTIPMMAGRALGHTGGTIDKLESIPGFKTELELEVFEKLVRQNGLAIMAQTKDIAPADRILYALRDVTATIDFAPFIISSIMSKKLAEGAKSLVFDVKFGNGAFMQTLEEAEKLAQGLMETATLFERNAHVYITRMNWPLGTCVGNALEIRESLDILSNQGGLGSKPLLDLSLSLAARMVFIAGKADSFEDALKEVNRKLENGSSLQSFSELIARQGGPQNIMEGLPEISSQKRLISASTAGHVYIKNCRKLGILLNRIGGGRLKQGDKIDHSTGFVFLVQEGDKVTAGQNLVEVLYSTGQENLIADFQSIFQEEIFEIVSSEVHSKRNRELITKELSC